MCLICVEFQKLTIPEATRNLNEMRGSVGDSHAQEVEEMIHERALKELEDMLKDFGPFVRSPCEKSSALEPVQVESFDDFVGHFGIPDGYDFSDDEPLELDLDWTDVYAPADD